jgi:hypothetical protein
MLTTEVKDGISKSQSETMFDLRAASSRRRPLKREWWINSDDRECLGANGRGHHFAVDPFQATYWNNVESVMYLTNLFANVS